MSLLGAVAYELMTRIDVRSCSCLCDATCDSQAQDYSCQKAKCCPTLGAGKYQEINFQASYWTLTSQMCGRCSIPEEEEAGHSLRGALPLRSFSDTNHGVPNPKTANYFSGKQTIANHSSPIIFTQACVIHIVDAICKAQRHVTRPTFSSELLSASDSGSWHATCTVPS